MNWQDDVPNTAGWFWIWPHGSHRPYLAHYDVVVNPEENTAIKLAVVRSPHGDQTDLALLPAQIHKWAGPVQGPPR